MFNASDIESPSDLRQLLYQRSQSFRNVLPFGPAPNPNLKWLYTSALQKAIHRGHSEIAAMCAASLSAIDPGYCWRRLPIIALEDVGFGNKIACALVLEAAKSAAFRRKLGERQVLFFLLDELCTSVKDRSLCDLAVLNHNRPPPAKLWRQYIDNLNLPFIDSYLAKNGRSASNLGVQVPLLIEEMPDDVSIVESPPDTYGDEIIANLPACAYDQHTREGKRAYAYFAKACRPVREYFDQNPELNPVKSIGIIMFLIESAILDRHLHWQGRSALLCRSQRRDCVVYGMTIEQAKQLQSIAQENRADLNEARRTIASRDT